ncbi:MAG TPA: VTT domain-containing protein [Terriglobia bacterium]|nr:VTT domain-containing protein [Terriglobia bacterium]
MNRLAGWVEQLLLPLGVWGLGTAAVLDSCFLPFPSGVDLWLITLSVRNPSRTPLYVLVAAAGSVAGASLLYLAARKGEEAFLKKKRIAAEKMERVRRKIERQGSLAVMVAALLPPPAPFKLFILAAGLLRFRWSRFAAALFVGRLIRYGLEGYLAVRYGRQAWQMLLNAGPWALAVAAVAGGLLLLLFWLRHRTPSPAS